MSPDCTTFLRIGQSDSTLNLVYSAPQISSIIYLEELQQELGNVRHIHVSTSTIARALRSHGFTRKQICCLLLFSGLDPC